VGGKKADVCSSRFLKELGEKINRVSGGWGGKRFTDGREKGGETEKKTDTNARRNSVHPILVRIDPEERVHRGGLQYEGAPNGLANYSRINIGG